MHLVSATQFKNLNRGRNVTGASLALRKQMIAPAEQLGGTDRALRFTISTDCIDREQDCIALTGWRMENFRKNPVVLWGHDVDRLPIGRAYDVRIENNALKATIDFVPADTPIAGDFADAVYRLARSGYLGATSVGFRPIKWQYTTDKARGADDWFPGIDFAEQELVELSVVTVPANPDALIEPAQTAAPASGADVVASDTPSETGDSVLHLFDPKQKEAIARARRRRAFQLAMAMGI